MTLIQRLRKRSKLAPLTKEERQLIIDEITERLRDIVFMERARCPRDGAELSGLYFMGDLSQPPDFLVCPSCRIAYDPATLEAYAEVI